MKVHFTHVLGQTTFPWFLLPGTFVNLCLLSFALASLRTPFGPTPAPPFTLLRFVPQTFGLPHASQGVPMWSFFLQGDLISHSIFVFADMIRRRHLRTRSIKMFVLDESDEMLNKGIPYLRNHSPCRYCNCHFYNETFDVDWSTFCFTS